MSEVEREKAKISGASSFPRLVDIDKQGDLSWIRGYKDFDILVKLLRR